LIIAHPKIQTMKPVWAKFNGYSLIFDSLDTSTAKSAFEFSNDPTTVAAFKGVAKALRSVGRRNLVRQTLVCLLPKSSYHVTVVDLIHQGNGHRVTEQFKDSVAAVLKRANPNTPEVDPVFPALGLTGGSNATFDLGLEFESITTMEGRALGLRLRPATQKDERILDELQLWRTELQERVLGAMGLPIRPFEPHLTLGYFPNEGVLDGQDDLIEEVEKEMAAHLKGKVFRFTDVSLYGFTGMHAFFRVVR
jgi:hypothetical protein